METEARNKDCQSGVTIRKSICLPLMNLVAELSVIKTSYLRSLLSAYGHF